jgi:hypothetical protein
MTNVGLVAIIAISVAAGHKDCRQTHYKQVAAFVTETDPCISSPLHMKIKGYRCCRHAYTCTKQFGHGNKRHTGNARSIATLVREMYDVIRRTIA